MLAEKIGILGGTFDPVHNGHLKIADLVRKKLKLDRVILVPAGTPPHKKRPAASRRDRLIMTRLAVKKWSGLEFSDFEIKKTGPAYSLTTIKHFKKLFPRAEIYFIVGLDSWRELDSWYRPAEILKLARLVVVYRPPAAEKSFQKGGRLLGPAELSRVKFFKIRGIKISSSDIRARRRHNKSLGNRLPPEVKNYILENNLY